MYSTCFANHKPRCCVTVKLDSLFITQQRESLNSPRYFSNQRNDQLLQVKHLLKRKNSGLLFRQESTRHKSIQGMTHPDCT